MRITVKVFVTLRKYLKAEWSQTTEFEVSLDDLPGSAGRIQDLVDYLRIPAKEIGQVILNGHIKRDKTIALNPGDRVILQPHIGGG
jgi:hypothetical protein